MDDDSALEPDENREWDPGGAPWLVATRLDGTIDIRDDHLHAVISAAIESNGTDEGSRTELDSHANMPVVGKNAYIVADLGKTVSVNPFTPDYDAMEVPLVDAAVRYDSPFDGRSYILVIRNALHVPAMSNNLIPPFAMREAGVKVCDTPKIQVENPTENNHAIVFPETGLRVPLLLWGVFSYFATKEPTTKEMNYSPDVYLLMPEHWNPHSDVYAHNEESMLDWEGNMKQPADRDLKIVLEEIPDDEKMVSSLQITTEESQATDDVLLEQAEDDQTPYCFRGGKHRLDPIASTTAHVSSVLHDETLYELMRERAEESRFKMSIGSTNILVETVSEEDSDDESVSGAVQVDDQNVVETVDEDDNRKMPAASNVPEPEEEMFNLDDWEFDEEEVEEFFVSATSGSNPKGVSAKHLSKIWRISVDDAKRTIDMTTQGARRMENPELSRNYSTNDRMLRYKRIKDYFFMDTFFAKKKGGKSSRGHTCCQLFVTDKGFVYVVPMRKKLEVLQAVKQFAKEIGAPDSMEKLLQPLL